MSVASAIDLAGKGRKATKAKPAAPHPGNLVLHTSLRPTFWIGTLGSLGLMVALILWAQFTMIASAVITSGQVLVLGSNKMVQSLDGGVVAEIAVKNGDRVSDGQVMVRLDPTVLQVNLDIARNRLAEALTVKARLEAEQLDLPVIDFSGLDAEETRQRLDGLPLKRMQIGQNQIFMARRAVQRGNEDRSLTKISQIRSQLEGVEVALSAKKDQLRFIESELADVVVLNKQGLARQSQVLDLQRSQSEMLAQIASDQSQIASLENAIRDAELEIAQNKRTFQEDVVTKLREATTQAEELVLQIVTTQKQLDRVEIKAPADGIVHELSVATVGGVVAPGATVMQIVPLGEGLNFEFRLDPKYIDQVYVGQKARLHFPAFKTLTTPNIYGTVSTISPTSITEQSTGRTFYRLDLDVPQEELARLGKLVLVPGMPVDAFLEAGDRSVLSYLIQPLREQLLHAFRDE